MLYFSQRALDDVDNVRHSGNRTTTVSFAKLVGVSRAVQISLDSPGAMDKVDFVPGRAKKVRRILRKICHLSDVGSVFDLRVSGLKIGVMPFLQFGERGEYEPDKVRTFWAQAYVRPSHFRSRQYELILLESLDNVVNGSWSAQKNELKIGHEYPSNSSVLSMMIQRELELAGDEIREHIDEVCEYEDLEEGSCARFASEQTARAQECVIQSDSYAPS
jgi:hypothetical protein